MSYKVTGKGSRSIVSFTCPTCSAPLESPLGEAGKRFPCPNCGRTFVTPGIDELKKLRAEETEAEALAEAARIRTLEAEAKLAAPPPVFAEQDPPETDVPPLNYADPLGELAAAAANAPPTQFIEMPEYRQILTGSFVLRLLSIVAYTVALLFLVPLIVIAAGLVRAHFQLQIPPSPADFVFIGAGLVGVSVYLMIGALLGLVSSLSLAVRDIARNSFRR